MIISRKFAFSAAIAATLAAGAVAIGQAAAQPSKPRACFFPRDVQSWAANSKTDTVNFRVGLKRYFQGELAGSCPDIDWSLRVGFDPRGAISICEGQEATLIVPSSTLGPQRCLVNKLRELTPAEVAALPKGSKP